MLGSTVHTFVQVLRIMLKKNVTSDCSQIFVDPNIFWMRGLLLYCDYENNDHCNDQ